MKKISKPNELWLGQQKAAWVKLGRSETPDRQVEDLAERTTTEHLPVQRAVCELAAKLAVTSADTGTANAAVEHRDADAARLKRKEKQCT